MTGSLSSLVPFGALVTFLYYVLARAEITRWFWEGWVQAVPVVTQSCKSLCPGYPESVFCALAIRHPDKTCVGHDSFGHLVEWKPERRPWARPQPQDARRAARFRAFLDRLLSCPMCSGFWLGLSVGWAFDLPVPWKPFQIAMGGVYGLILCPIILGAMSWLRHMEHDEAMDAQRSEESRAMHAIAAQTQDTLSGAMGRMDAMGTIAEASTAYEAWQSLLSDGHHDKARSFYSAYRDAIEASRPPPDLQSVPGDVLPFHPPDPPKGA